MNDDHVKAARTALERNQPSLIGKITLKSMRAALEAGNAAQPGYNTYDEVPEETRRRYGLSPMISMQAARHYAEAAKHDHDERCCTVHQTHSSPHKGCILR